MAQFSKYMGSDEHEAGTGYPSGMTGKKNAKGYLGPAGGWSPSLTQAGSASLQGLQGAMGGGNGGIPPSGQEDPLGIGVQQRGMQHAMYAGISGQRAPGGPLPDPQWEGLFQALAEHNVNKVGGAPELHGAAISGVEQPPPGYVEPPAPVVMPQVVMPHVTMPTIQGTPGAIHGAQPGVIQGLQDAGLPDTTGKYYQEGLDRATRMFPGLNTPNTGGRGFPSPVQPEIIKPKRGR